MPFVNCGLPETINDAGSCHREAGVGRRVGGSVDLTEQSHTDTEE